jgi:membrane dipeptidase
VEPAEHAGRYARRALELADAVLEQCRRHPKELVLCRTPAEILAARESGRFAVLMGLEGGHAIENSLGLLRTFHRMGVTYMTLTWNNSNEWADSSHEAPRHHGLSPFGVEVVAEMNRLGMMIDVSHASDKTFEDVLAHSVAPVIASHSSARAVTPSPRNLTDDQLRALAARGGMAMVNFFPAFVDSAWNEAWDANRAERRAMFEAEAKTYRAAGQPVPYHVVTRIDRMHTARIPRPSFESLMAHFHHMIRVAGIDHVGVGTDFDGIPDLPAGIDSAADLPRITAALCAHGYSAEDVHKVLGGNLMRVFGEVQAVAESLATSPPAE